MVTIKIVITIVLKSLKNSWLQQNTIYTHKNNADISANVIDYHRFSSIIALISEKFALKIAILALYSAKR